MMTGTRNKVIIVAKAASGKDFFKDFVHSRGIRVDVSYTTRPPRTGEIEGYTYNYISDEEFDKMKEANKFMETANFNGWKYGTSKESWENSFLFIMTPSGIASLPNEELKECVIVYLDIPIEIRKERLMKRSDADSVDRRIEADEIDFDGFYGFDIKVTHELFNPEELLTLIQELL